MKYRANCINSPTPFQHTPPSVFTQTGYSFTTIEYNCPDYFQSCSILPPVQLLTNNSCDKIMLSAFFPANMHWIAYISRALKQPQLT